MHLVSDPELIREALVVRHRDFHKGVGLQRARALIGDGLLTSEDELHRRQRRLIQPAFHHQRIEEYTTAMVACAARTDARWHDLAAGSSRASAAGAGIDAHAEMMRLTLMIVGRTLFDFDVEDRAAAIGRAMEACLALFQRIGTMPFADLLEWLPLPGNFRYHKGRRELNAIVYGMIRERQAGAAGRGDLISMLLRAVDDETGARMTEMQVRDEVITLFLAGHETTADALAWSWLLLAQHPAVEARLHEEVATVLGDRLATAADVARLAYTRAVVAEALRLYPPAWIIGRRAIVDTEIGGYTVPTGSIVLASPWVVHHDARWFAEPERFEPDRWLDGSEATRPRLSFFPFGAGPRICIGEQFAWTEAVLVLATLARRWRLRPAPNLRVGLRPSITLRPRWGLSMLLEPRAAVA
jgi:cytochrome P450